MHIEKETQRCRSRYLQAKYTVEKLEQKSVVKHQNSQVSGIMKSRAQTESIFHSPRPPRFRCVTCV